MVLSPATTAILFTLAYADQFDYPLTELELWSRLISVDKKSISQAEFDRSLQQLIKNNTLLHIHEFFLFSGREGIVLKRQRRTLVAQQKWQQIQLLKRVTPFLAGISAIFITGSLAMNNTNQDDDIDIFIVTKIDRLWLCRLELLFFTWIIGQKKKRVEEGKHGWCLNLWLDEEHLAVEEGKRDLYRAYEVVQAKLLWGTTQIADRFYTANSWVKEYLPKNIQHHATSLSSENDSVGFTFIDQLEHLAFRFQLRYMKSHQTTEKVGPGFAFFHPRQTDALIREGWLKSVSRIKNMPGLDTIAKQHAKHFFASPATTLSQSP